MDILGSGMVDVGFTHSARTIALVTNAHSERGTHWMCPSSKFLGLCGSGLLDLYDGLVSQGSHVHFTTVFFHKSQHRAQPAASQEAAHPNRRRVPGTRQGPPRGIEQHRVPTREQLSKAPNQLPPSAIKSRPTLHLPTALLRIGPVTSRQLERQVCYAWCM